jgi:hypothetical protein
MIALVTQLKGGIRPALRYCNSPSIADLHEQTIELVKVAAASRQENSRHALSLSPAAVARKRAAPEADGRRLLCYTLRCPSRGRSSVG